MPTEQSELECLSTLHNEVTAQCEVIMGNIESCYLFLYFLSEDCYMKCKLHQQLMKHFGASSKQRPEIWVWLVKQWTIQSLLKMFYGSLSFMG